jgi:hypothetical protein
MNFFYRWLHKKLNDKLNNYACLEVPEKVSSRGFQSLDSQGMNFTVYKANGGFVIEHRVYDRKTDRNNNSLHIITPDQDLGEELGKIITYESMLN